MSKGLGARPVSFPLRVLEEKEKRNFSVVLGLAALGVVIQAVECTVLWRHAGEANAMCEVLKLLSSFFTLWLVLFLFVYYKRKFEVMKATNALLAQDTLTSSGLLFNLRGWSFLPEALLCAVHAPPFVSAELTLPYYDLQRGATLPTVMSTDELLTVAMLFARSVLLVRWTPYLAGLTAKHARAYANMNHLTLTTWLAVRLTYLRYPLRVLASSTAVFGTIVAFAMQAAERRVNGGLDHFGNCAWLTTVSMTGIGFGDFVPMTGLGRLLSSAAFVWGAFMAALVVMTILRTFELSNAEVRVNNLVHTSASKTRLRQVAAIYIQAAWSAYLEKLQRSQSAVSSAPLLGGAPLHADPKFCRSMRGFRELRKKLHNSDDVLHLIFKEVLDTRTRLELQLHALEERVSEMNAQFEHNINAMNELLQKNLKYLKHLAP